MGKRARGAMTASQVSAGRKNRLSIEIYGTKSSVAWNQERPDELWSGHRDVANQIFIKDPSLLKPAARTFADLPGGHSEGYDDTFKQVFRRFYASIAAPGARARVSAVRRWSSPTQNPRRRAAEPPHANVDRCSAV